MTFQRSQIKWTFLYLQEMNEKEIRTRIAQTKINVDKAFYKKEVILSLSLGIYDSPSSSGRIHRI